MRTIVALIDFSPVSLNAARYAAEMARAINANLSLLHVCEVPMVFSEIPYPAENLAENINNAEERIRLLKADLVPITAGKIKMDTKVKTGTFVSEAADYCESINPFLVIMGTQGSGAIERTFFGSNTISAMKHLSWPLIIVPPGARFTSIKKIGLACDMKKVVETLPVNVIKSLVRAVGARLFILYIAKEAGPVYSTDAMEEFWLLQELLKELRPAYRFLNNRDIEEGLRKFAESNDLDLLIVVPKKHNVVNRLIHKSQSRNLALHTTIPLMAVHEP